MVNFCQTLGQQKDYLYFAIVNVQYLYRNIPTTPSHGGYILQLISFAEAYSLYSDI